MAVNHVDDPTLGEFDDIHAACDYAAYNSIESGGESGYGTHSDSSNSPPITPEVNISHPTFPTETLAISSMESRKWSIISLILKVRKNLLPVKIEKL